MPAIRQLAYLQSNHNRIYDREIGLVDSLKESILIDRTTAARAGSSCDWREIRGLSYIYIEGDDSFCPR